MAALKQEHRYGLSCGKINKSIPNKTIFHVKLTDTAIRTLEAYKNLKVTHLVLFRFYISSSDLNGTERKVQNSELQNISSR